MSTCKPSLLGSCSSLTRSTLASFNRITYVVGRGSLISLPIFNFRLTMITKRPKILVCVWLLLTVSPIWTLPERIEEWPDVEDSRPLKRVKRIIGGHPVLKGTYPWAVSIQARRYHGLNAVFRPNNEHYCGAALIKPDWILTAAHCLYTEDDNGNLESKFSELTSGRDSTAEIFYHSSCGTILYIWYVYIPSSKKSSSEGRSRLCISNI
ncbi:hypothetical protein CRM22_001946 [Opisthorchis felineus]|uniref:Peptidase S1 domain-containing protein n=1 Tax=Opisthorchis felineus TaxID=147828 RepID=A0A4S2MCR8_OPIFE|nr:hypothetical protein CRM22_001946 [Opisthorchis felineus]